MTLLGAGFFFASPPRPSPNLNAAPSLVPVFLVFDIAANAAPALTAIRLRFDILTTPAP